MDNLKNDRCEPIARQWLICLLLSIAMALSWGAAAQTAIPVTPKALLAQHSSSTFAFQENKGQVRDQHDQPRPDVRYSATASGLTCHFKADGWHYQLSRPFESAGKAEGAPDSVTVHRVDLSWVGANPSPRILPTEPLPARRHFYNKLAGQKPVLDVKSYRSIKYESLYPGIDLHCYEGPHAGLEYDFIVQPGADYTQIRLHFQGAELSVDAKNRLLLSTPLGTIAEGELQVHQDGQPIEAEWALNGQEVSFRISGEYDASRPLVIDPPVRVWGTYYGDRVSPRHCQTDEQGDLYLTGAIASGDLLATSGVFQTTKPGVINAFLSKFDAGGQLVWSTYFGGSHWDEGEACAPNADGDVYLAGVTRSFDFPSTPGVHEENYQGFDRSANGFLAKFNGLGQLEWSTFYGSDKRTQVFNCALSPQGEVYIVGSTQDQEGIATPGTYQEAPPGGIGFPFLAKFSSDGQRLWGTYYGGDSGSGVAHGCAIDQHGDIYISGTSVDMPGMATPGTFQDSLPPGSSSTAGFLAKLSSEGQQIWGTYITGNLNVGLSHCAVDELGGIYLAGNTRSDQGITSPGAYQELTFSTEVKTFLAKFDGSGQRLWSTYYGGNGPASFRDLSVSKSGQICLTGNTLSPILIATLDAHQFNLTGDDETDAYLARFNSDGQLEWGTYYGGEDRDSGLACAFDPWGNMYLVGETRSNSQISTTGSFQDTLIIPDSDFNVTPSTAMIAKFGCADSSSVQEVACGQFTLNGRTYTESGTYRQLLKNASGCDSLLTLELEVRPTLIGGTFFASICEGQAFPFGGTFYDSTGIYFDTLASQVTGCDSIVSMDLTVLPASVDSLTVTACQSYTFRGQTYTESGAYTQNFINSFGCESTAQLQLEIVPFWTSAIYDTICLGAAYSFGDSLYQAAGNYTQVLTASVDGCDSIVTLALSVVEALPSIEASSWPATCPELADGQATVAVEGSPPFDYSWSNGETGPAITGLSLGVYGLTVTDRFGCVVSDSVDIGLSYTLGNLFEVEGLACFGDSTATVSCLPQGSLPPYSFQWAHGPTDSVLTQLPAGTYRLTITDGNGCRAVDSLTLSEPSPLMAATTVIGPACLVGALGEAEVEFVGGTPPYSYEWSDGQANALAVGLVSGDYALTVTDANDCSSVIEVSLPAHPAPQASAAVAQSPTCPDAEDGILLGEASEGTPPYAYRWSDGQEGEEANGLLAGLYALTVVDGNGCEAFAEVLMEAGSYTPALGLQQDGNTLISDELSASYQWLDCNSGSPIPGATERSFTPEESGSYALLLSQGPCRDTTDCVTVMVVSSSDLSGQSRQVELFPNPNDGRFYLRLPAPAELSLYSATGQLLLRQPRGAGLHELAMALPAGPYLLRVEGQGWQRLLWMVRQ